MKTKEELRDYVLESLQNMTETKLTCRTIYVEIANKTGNISEDERVLRNLAYNLWQAFENVSMNIERAL